MFIINNVYYSVYFMIIRRNNLFSISNWYANDASVSKEDHMAGKFQKNKWHCKFYR